MVIFSLLSVQCEKSNQTNVTPAQGSYTQNIITPSSPSRDFLESKNYKTLKIEIQYMPGLKPDPASINILVDLLNEKLNKPGGIIVEEKQIDPTLQTVFNLRDIAGIESRNRTAYASGDQLGVYILFINGTYSNGNILGLTNTNTSICFFGEPLEYFLSGGTQEDKINKLAFVISHEFGHLQGLVNIGSPMVVNHLENINGNHCNNSMCLMHHTLEEINPLEKNNPEFERFFLEKPSFDKNCSDDLKANGGK